MKRKHTRQISLGSVQIGGGAPVSVQSMANTDTKDIAATVKQIKGLEKAGCEIIRVSVKDRESALAIKGIKKRIAIPLEADIHFNYRLAILAAESGADGIRLNPGNIHNPKQVRSIISVCRQLKIPIRIGANSGSLHASAKGEISPQSGGKRYSQENALVKSVLGYLKIFQKDKFNDLMISLKASNVSATIDAYRKVSSICDYPLHLGVTATGQGEEAIVKSSIGIGALLSEGIGDTIRVSLTANPEDEVVVARHILQALGLRRFYHEVISCPTCGRCQVNLEKIVRDCKKKLLSVNPSTTLGAGCQPLDYARGRLSQPKAGPPPAGTKQSLAIALMGCEVNGPGEAKGADIGIAFGRDSGILFRKGKIIKKVSAKNAITELLRELKQLI
jgi:(E)-4-hydroxy-3-methylbut-2-enyl-diphosphate synthase